MSNYGGGAQHGDKFNKKDKYDNPIQYTGGNIGGHGHKTHTVGSGEHGNKGHAGPGGCCGILPSSNNSSSNSSSSSSSSSEDDGKGGRRKKSIKEKIKEKLPGGNKPATGGQGENAYAHGHGATTTPPGENYGEGYGDVTTTTPEAHDEQQQQQPAEKKGFMEKIKDKLPGHH